MSPHLSFDIQLEIIKRLPVKSLIQFRSVCKEWKSLIDSSDFIAGYNVGDDHLLATYEVGDWQQEVKCVCFVDDDTFPQQKFSLTAPPIIQVILAIGSSHGVLCLIGHSRRPDVFGLIAILWNPTIRKSITVVVPDAIRMWFNFVVGFGVCPRTNNPKIVKITYIDDFRRTEGISCTPNQVMVFALNSREWRTSCSNLPRKSIHFDNSFQTVGQFIYWLATDVGFRFRKLIMSFDISTEEFREIDLPDSLATGKADLTISRLRESLVVVEDGDVLEGSVYTAVWMMEHGDPKTFTKLFTINASVNWIVGFRKSGEPIIECQDDMVELTSTLAVYEPCLEKIKDLGICGIYHSFSVNSYTESLLLLDHDDGCIISC